MVLLSVVSLALYSRHLTGTDFIFIFGICDVKKINQTNKKTNKKPQASLKARAVIRMFVVVLGLNFRENFTIVSYLIQKLQLISSVTVPVQKQLPAWICTLLNLPLVWLLGLVGCTVTFFHLCKAFPVDNSEVQAK